MPRTACRPSLWLALVVVLGIVACGEKKSGSTNQAPAVSDLRVRQESGGVAGAPTRFSMTLAFSDAGGDVATMEVKRQDTGEVTTADLPDAGGKTFGLAEGTFEITADAPGNVPFTVALVDTQNQRSGDLPFVIGIQSAPAPSSEEPPAEEALRPRGHGRSVMPLGTRVRAR